MEPSELQIDVMLESIKCSKDDLQSLADVMLMRPGWVKMWKKVGEATGLAQDMQSSYMKHLREHIADVLTSVKMYVIVTQRISYLVRVSSYR